MTNEELQYEYQETLFEQTFKAANNLLNRIAETDVNWVYLKEWRELYLNLKSIELLHLSQQETEEQEEFQTPNTIDTTELQTSLETLTTIATTNKE